MTPEQRARVTIDTLLQAAGWRVCNLEDANIGVNTCLTARRLHAGQTRIVAEVDRHLSIIRDVETEVDANLQRAQALRQATLSKMFDGSHV
jgi:hypothetical protein